MKENQKKVIVMRSQMEKMQRRRKNKLKKHRKNVEEREIRK